MCADKCFIASLFFWRSSQVFLFIVLQRIDSLEHFASVNTSSVGVFRTEAKKIAFLVTVWVLLKYILDSLCRYELCKYRFRGRKGRTLL